MSVIVGLVDEGEIFMGSDSACSSLDGGWVREENSAKVWRLGEFLVGIVGKCRVSDLIVEGIEPEPKVTEFEFVELVRTALRIGGALKTQNGVETMEAEILLGWRGDLFHIVSNFGIFRPKSAYHAIGAGAQFALGALHAIEGTDWVPWTKVNMAIEAAAAFSPSVGGRVNGLRMKAEETAA